MDTQKFCYTLMSKENMTVSYLISIQDLVHVVEGSVQLWFILTWVISSAKMWYLKVILSFSLPPFLARVLLGCLVRVFHARLLNFAATA